MKMGGEFAKEKTINSYFSLSNLPDTALSIVLHSMPLKTSCKLSLVNKKFLEAFRNNVTWKHLCEKDLILDPAYLEAELRKQNLNSWFDFYRDNATWTITIVTVFRHRGGTSISGEFSLSASPKISVEDFIQLARNHPKNEQPAQEFTVFDEMADLCSYKKSHRTPPSKNSRPHKCKNFDASIPGQTIKQAGLCNNAILKQCELNMCD